MIAEQATERTVIDAPLQRCLDVVLAFERYPEWARDIKRAEVIERDDQGRGVQVAFRAAAMGQSTRYTLAYSYAEDPVRIAWVLQEGDIMRRLDGEYDFADQGESTDVTYRLAVELAIPLPGFVKRRAESKIMGTALHELKRRCEDPA